MVVEPMWGFCQLLSVSVPVIHSETMEITRGRSGFTGPIVRWSPGRDFVCHLISINPTQSIVVLLELQRLLSVKSRYLTRLGNSVYFTFQVQLLL